VPSSYGNGCRLEAGAPGNDHGNGCRLEAGAPGNDHGNGMQAGWPELRSAKRSQERHDYR